MNALSNEKRAQVVDLLVEGMSIRAIVRVSGVAKGTVLKLLADLGTACPTGKLGFQGSHGVSPLHIKHKHPTATRNPHGCIR
jgi:ABC-type nitrate/sulfonate/bicarbonate transport system ATPase subunit